MSEVIGSFGSSFLSEGYCSCPKVSSEIKVTGTGNVLFLCNLALWLRTVCVSLRSFKVISVIKDVYVECILDLGGFPVQESPTVVSN